MALKDPVCQKNDMATELDVTAGEKLLYEVEILGGAQPVFTIVGQQGDVILGSENSEPDPDGVYRVTWPADPGGVPVPGDLNYQFGMSFITATKYGYKITKVAAGGTRTLLKDCVYESDPHDSNDTFQVAFRSLTK